MRKKKSIRDVEMIMKEKLDYKKAKMFLHCGHCLQKFLGSKEHDKKSPREAFSYEISTYPFEYPGDFAANIIVVWCKKCGRSVWDSRHLINAF